VLDASSGIDVVGSFYYVSSSEAVILSLDHRFLVDYSPQGNDIALEVAV
jgi:hypothetical protein